MALIDSSPHNLGGAFRQRTAADTLTWLLPLCTKVGITRVANVTGLDKIGIPIVTAIRPNSRLLSVSQGKGVTLTLAKISAIMEAVESYHGENVPQAQLNGNYTSLSRQHTVINPNHFASGAFSYSQLEYHYMGWVAAKVLTESFNEGLSLVYVPEALASLNTTRPRIEYSFFNVSTNGFAAGNTHAEALCHALYEVIERDNLSHFQNNFKHYEVEQIDLNRIYNPMLRALILKLQARLKLVVWDITGNSQIPTFHAAIYDPNDPFSYQVHTGTGTHLLPEIAFSRAITEAAQARVTIITGQRDDIFPEYYQAVRKKAHPMNKIFFEPGRKLFRNDYDAYAKHYPSFEKNISTLRNSLALRQHRDIYWLDHTKPDINIPVVQVLVPSLRHDHSRL